MNQQNQNKNKYSGGAFWNNPNPVSEPQPTPVNEQPQTVKTEPPASFEPVHTNPDDAAHPVITSEKKTGLPTKKAVIIIAAAAAVVIGVSVAVILVLSAQKPNDNNTLQATVPVTTLFSVEDSGVEETSTSVTTTAPQTTEHGSTTAAPTTEIFPETTAPKPIDAQVEFETKKAVVSNASYFVSASASSVLGDQQGHSYVPSNVLRNNDACWCENASDEGVGEWIRLDLPELQKVSGLRIVNGYAGTAKQYDYNSKISEMNIEFSDGRSTNVSLNVFRTADRKTVQTIRFNEPVETEYVRLTITSVTKGDCSDTCLTFVEPF